MIERDIQIKKFKEDRENSFYVYIHKRKSDNKPFYVGKGTKYRAWATNGRSIWWNNIVNKHELIVEIVFDSLTSSEAFNIEKDVILEFNYFGYPLVNLNAGGKGGSTPSKETRIKQSTAKIGKYKGLKNPYSDKTIYYFINDILNITKICSRSELCELYNIPNDQLKKLFALKPRKTVYGWKLKGL